MHVNKVWSTKWKRFCKIDERIPYILIYHTNIPCFVLCSVIRVEQFITSFISYVFFQRSFAAKLLSFRCECMIGYISTLMLSSMLWEVLPLSICSQCFHASIISLWMHRRIDLGLGCLYTSVTICVVKMTNCECTHSCPPPLFHDLRVFHIDPSFSCKLLLIVLIWNHELEKYIKYEQSLKALSKTEDFFFDSETLKEL